MTKRRGSQVSNDAAKASDIDLERDDYCLADGTRLTPAVAEAIVEEFRRVGGRPSLSGTASQSPQIAFRVAAAKVVADEGKTVSQLAREALEARLGP
jgi:hypothetical protein